MALLQLKAFGGEVPVQGIRALPDSFAVESVNTWLYSSELRAIHPSIKLRDCLSTTKKVFRIPRGTVGGDPAFPTVIPPPSYLGDSTWLEFADVYTDIVRGPLVNDQYKRWYFCSPTTGLLVNSYARLELGEAPYTAGVPNPVAVLGITVSGGSSPDNVTRAYFYTFISQWGEESGPSPPVTAAGKADGSWDVTNILDPAAGVFDPYVPYQKKRLYRSATSQSGITTFFMVADIPPATTTYSDTLPETQLVGNLSFENVNGALPPAGLQGIVAMPNGFLIGWRDDTTLCFSEPYKPYSWPPEYEVATEYPIVGLGVFGQTCAVLTQGFPSTVQGIMPATTALAKSQVMEPCLTRGGIVVTPDAVYYPGPNGLVSVSPNGVQNITQQLITKEEWGRDFSPSYLRACRYQQGYLAIRAVDTMADRTAFYFDLSKLETAVTELSEFDYGRNAQGDVWSGEILIVRNNEVQHYDPQTTKFLPYRWKSKEFTYPFKNNFAVYELFWDPDRADLTSTEAPELCPVGVAAHVKVWADRVLVYDQNVPVNQEAIRLPSGFKALAWQFEIAGRAPVFAFHVASTLKELRGA